MKDKIEDAVRTFVVDNFLFGDDGHDLAETDSLIEKGVIDSTGVLELVAFLEDRFGLVIADAEIVPANLDSLARIAAYIRSKAPALTLA